jgi:monoamine oxidase
LTESILDYADFPPNATWHRVEGGMIKLIEAMDTQLKTHATLNRTVRAFKMHNDNVDVTFSNKQGKLETRTYSAVFNSTTLGALGRIELNGLGSEDQITAIRSLAYDNAAKIAIKFRSAWWIEKGGMTKLGGVSGTDLPIRVVAYPAWTDKDDPKKSTVLIASYTWHQDATRMGSLINNSTKPSDGEALGLVLRNLSTMFESRDPTITFDFLMDQVEEYYGYSWANDPYSSGAFALFGPNQFTNLYPALFSPLKGSDNNVYIIGEHASAHHAWTSGALYSAATSLYGWLMGLGEEGKRLAEYLMYCGDLPFGGTINQGEIIKPPKDAEVSGGVSLEAHAESLEAGVQQGSLPDEMDEQVVYWMAQLAKRMPTDERLKPRM